MLGIANRTREKTAATICATPPPVIVSCYCRQPMRCVRLCLTAQTHRWLRQHDAAISMAVPPLRGHRPTPLGTVSPLRSMTLATAVVAACVSSTSPVGRQGSLLQGPGLLGSMMPRPSRALAALESASTNPLAVFLCLEDVFGMRNPRVDLSRDHVGISSQPPVWLRGWEMHTSARI